MEIIIALILLVGAVAVVGWALRSMARYRCPECAEIDSEEGFVIPIVPGFIWWCPSCGESSRTSDLIDKNKNE